MGLSRAGCCIGSLSDDGADSDPLASLRELSGDDGCQFEVGTVVHNCPVQVSLLQ